MTWDEWVGGGLPGRRVVIPAGVASAEPFVCVRNKDVCGHISHCIFDRGLVSVRFDNGNLDSFPYEGVVLVTVPEQGEGEG